MSLFGRDKYQPVIDVMGGIRVNTSLQGVPIPIVYGRNRIAPNLIWYSDFFWEQIATGKKGSTAGSGTGKKAGGEYDYGAAVILGLCQGPISGIGTVWTTTGNLPIQTAVETFTVPGGGGSYTALNQATYQQDAGVTRGDGYSVVVNDFGSVPSSITLAGIQQTPMAFQTSGSPSTGKYTRTGTNRATYNFAAGDAGKTMSISYTYTPPFTATGLPQDPIASAGFTLFNGTQGQAVWSYLTSKHPAQAIGYTTLAYLATQVLDLGMSAVTPNFNFEVFGLLPFLGTVGSVSSTGGKSALSAEDSFTNAGGTLDSNWTQPTGTWQVVPPPAFPPFTLTGAALPSHVIADGRANAFWNANPFGADQVSQVNVGFGGSPTIFSHPTGYVGAAVRMAATGETYYAFLVGNFQFGGSGPLWRLDKVVAGVATNLAGGAIPAFNQGINVGPEIRLSIQGTILTASIGGTEVAQVSDSSISTGQPGIAAYNIASVTDHWQAITIWQASQTAFGTNPLGPNGDSNPADVLNDIFTNQLYGCGVLKSELGDFTPYSSYCVALGLFMSPVLDSERTAADWIRDILDATNSEIVESGGLLKILPYGDTSVVGNGVQYTPATNPIYNLTADSFIRSGTDPAIEITRPSVQDAYNAVRIEYVDRGNAYNASMVEAQDLNSLQTYKYRPDAMRQYHMYTSQFPAALIAQLILSRHVYIRLTYKFKLPQSYILLDPMDLVTIPAQLLGMAASLPAVPVRITSINEQEDRTLEVIAEQFPWGTAGNTLFPKQALIPGGPNVMIPPGSVNTPIIFEALSRMNNQVGHSIWFGVSGQQSQTAIAADNFARAALGSNWGTNDQAMIINASTDFEPSNSGSCSARWLLNNPFPPDQSSKAQLTAVGGGSSDTIGVAVRMDPANANTYYYLRVCNSTTTSTLFKNVAGSQTSLGTFSYTPTIGDILELRAIGTRLECLVNGVSKLTVYDSSIASGQPGISGSKAVSVGTAAMRATNWVGSQAFGTNPNWGGCRIWLSNDGTNYKQVGTAIGATKMGVLSANLASHADPDTVDTLSVDLTESGGALSSFTSAQTDLFASLCYVDGELIAYQAATLTSEFQYGLATKLRRGVYGSTIGAHLTGSVFMFLDDSVEGFNYDPALIGTTVHFKFTSFNQSGLVEENIANVTAYSYTVTGTSIGLLAAAHASYAPTTNPLTAHDAGASVTINVASFVMRVPGLPDLAFGSGAITGLSYNTLYYVYFDDPSFVAIPSPIYAASTTKTDALNAGGRLYVGSVLTPVSGGADNPGNGDGGAGAQIGQTVIGRFASQTNNVIGNGSVVNPNNAIDGNGATFATLGATGNSANNEATLIAKNPPASLNLGWSSLEVGFTFSVPTNAVAGDPNGVVLEFSVSTDGGGSFGVGYTLYEPGSPHTPNGTQTLQTVFIPLSPSVNLNNVQARVDVLTDGTQTSGAISVQVNEIFLQGVQ